MKSVIVGTAGHIDHGKTALVKALTGIDADRLEEEKRRGITIDIGFAHLELGKNGTLTVPSAAEYRLGFVDVPGHERFVRNMLAGIGGIDLVLLVIAADEGVMPQTREHFDICRLLNGRRGITVLTKSDSVDEETLGVGRMEAEEFVRESFLDAARSPIIAVSAKTGAGLQELRAELARAADEVPAKDSSAIFRLPIDRVFTMKGFGTVVTRTLISGEIRKEDELQVFPSGRRLRVRGIQVHGEAAEMARAGERTAINLAGVNKDDLTRGMMLTTPELLRPSKRFDLRLTLLPDAKRLKNRSRVHLHTYASEMVAQAVLQQDASPDSSVFTQLRTREPLLMLPGDRFVVRQFSPVVTIGGGVVLDAFPPRRRTADAEAFLQTMLSGSAEDQLCARVQRSGQRGITLAEAVAETGWTPERVAKIAAAQPAIVRLGEALIAKDEFIAAQEALVRSLTQFHDTNPLVAGVSRSELQERTALPEAILSAAIEKLVLSKKIEIAGDTLRLAGRGVVMKDEEAEAKRTIESAFAKAGLKVPALKEVLAALPLDKTRAQKIVTLLLRDRVLVKLSDDLVFHRDALSELREALKAQKARSAKIDVASFKELTGVSRKYAIPLLEFLDRERVTRREGDVRVIL